MHAIVAKHQKNSVRFAPLQKKIIVPRYETSIRVQSHAKLQKLFTIFLYLSERQMGELAEEGGSEARCLCFCSHADGGFRGKMPTENAAARASVGRLRRLIGEQRTCPLPLPCHSTEKLSKEGKETGEGGTHTRGHGMKCSPIHPNPDGFLFLPPKKAQLESNRSSAGFGHLVYPAPTNLIEGHTVIEIFI